MPFSANECARISIITWVINTNCKYSPEQILKFGTSSQAHGRMGWIKWQMGRSTNLKISRSFIYSHSKGNGNVWCITCAKVWTQVCHICAAYNSNFCWHEWFYCTAHKCILYLPFLFYFGVSQLRGSEKDRLDWIFILNWSFVHPCISFFNNFTFFKVKKP